MRVDITKDRVRSLPRVPSTRQQGVKLERRPIQECGGLLDRKQLSVVVRTLVRAVAIIAVVVKGTLEDRGK